MSTAVSTLDQTGPGKRAMDLERARLACVREQRQQSRLRWDRPVRHVCCHAGYNAENLIDLMDSLEDARG